MDFMEGMSAGVAGRIENVGWESGMAVIACCVFGICRIVWDSSVFVRG